MEGDKAKRERTVEEIVAERGPLLAEARKETTHADLCQRLAKLLDQKAAAYGDAIESTAEAMRALYPSGIRPDQYRDASLTVRLLDKLARVSNRGADGKDKGGESPWADAAGYCVRAWQKDEER